MKNQVMSIGFKVFGLATLASCLTIFEIAASKNVSQIGTSRMPASISKTCVLFYEREDHPGWKQVQRLYEKIPAVLIGGAKPQDVVNCVLKHNPRELVIIGHNMNERSTSSEITYFDIKSQEDINRSYSQTLAQIKKEHSLIFNKKGFLPCRTSRQDLTPCRGVQKKEFALRTKLQWLSKLSVKDPAFRMLFLYQEKKMSDKPFENLYSLMKTSSLKLKGIRFASSNPENLFAAYPSLKTISAEQGVRVSAGTPKKLLSLKPSGIKKRLKTAHL